MVLKWCATPLVDLCARIYICAAPINGASVGNRSMNSDQPFETHGLDARSELLLNPYVTCLL